MMELIFKTKKKANKKKLLGSYYTPFKLSKFITEWAIDSNTKSILEPSCGDGSFLISASETIRNKNLKMPKFKAVEIEELEIKKAKQLLPDIDCKWINDDFFNAFTSLKKEKFSLIIGNPPFIRFQEFNEESRNLAFEHLKSYSFKPTKLANVWSAFIQLCIEIVETKGKLAMVIPAELLQVRYASELRNQIINNFNHIILITFKKLVFKDIQQEVILLLAEDKKEKLDTNSSVHTIEVNDENDLSLDLFNFKEKLNKEKLIHPGMKWTSFFIDNTTFNFLDKISKSNKLHKLSDFCEVNVGIVTGRNSFFVVNAEILKNFQLKNFTNKLVGKTSALNTLSFNKEDFLQFEEKNDAYLLNLKDVNPNSFSDGLNEYIKLGEDQDVDKGYKCKIRKEWYIVPSVYVSDGFLFRQIHKYPLLVENQAKVLCTDTIHRVILKNKNINFKLLSVLFINSLTFVWCELSGRSYGGGVLELEPNEANNIILPYSEDIDINFDYLNNLIINNQIDEALAYNDKKILIDYLGLSQQEVISLNTSWKILRDRRINRK